MKLSKKEFLDILKNKEACTEAVKWVNEHQAETFIELWNTCEQADWMLWILAKMIKEKEWPSKKTVVLCACDCAETSLEFIPKDELRPKIAIQTAREWAEGKATIEECEKAAYAEAAYAAFAAYAAYFYSDADASDAAYAACATVSAVYVVSAVAVNAAVYAAAATAAADDAYAAEKEARKNMADIIRKRVSF
jgi:hypothetical protein